MSKNDINSLGSVYGGMLNGLKRDLIKEGKVGPGDIGEAELEDGGPEAADGFAEAEVDVEKLSDKEKEENLYDIDKHSYTHKYVPATAEEDEEVEEDAEEDAEEDEEKPDYIDIDKDGDKEESMKKAAKDAEEEREEDEESSQISEKIAQDSLNNFMKQKSQFDSLYNKVMVSENYEEMESEDLDALGLDVEASAETSDDSDEVTVTISKEVAQALCDVLQAAMGESDDEDGDEDGFEGALEEDEEGIDTGSTLNTSYDDGKNNKVGDLKSQGAASETCCDNEVDAGSTHSGSYDDGKNNKVGSLKTGQRAFDK